MGEEEREVFMMIVDGGDSKIVGCGSTEQAEGLGPDSLTYH